MPKEATVPSLSFDRSTASPYLSPAKTAKIARLRKFWDAVHRNKKDKEEVRCSICLEPPHNAVLLQCPNIEEGCHSYMCHTNNRHSNCFSQFRKSNPTLSCPQCKGKVNGCIVLNADCIFMNSRLRRCAVVTCEFTGTYLELENHSILEHPSVRPSLVDPVCKMRLERERDLEALSALHLS